MNTTELMTITAIIVVAGQWAQKKPLNIKIGVGAVFAAMGLAVIDRFEPSLAVGFAVTALTAATLVNGPPLFAAINKAVN